MDVQFDMADDVTVLTPSGNLVASETSSFNAQMKKLVENDARFVLLDMSRVTFMDSSGLDAVMAVCKHAASSGGIFACAALPDNIQKVFRITWADHKIPIAATRSDGLLMIRELRHDQG